MGEKRSRSTLSLNSGAAGGGGVTEDLRHLTQSSGFPELRINKLRVPVN